MDKKNSVDPDCWLLLKPADLNSYVFCRAREFFKKKAYTYSTQIMSATELEQCIEKLMLAMITITPSGLDKQKNSA